MAYDGHYHVLKGGIGKNERVRMKIKLFRKRDFFHHFLVHHTTGYVVFLLIISSTNTILALPSGQQVVSGQAVFDTQDHTLIINNTPNSIIDWQKFSIQANEAVRFIQKNNRSAVLNRIIGQDPSLILGFLQSNGRVFLVNPNGLIFGEGAKIDVNGLVASTLGISNQDFLTGRYNFSAGPTAAAIRNQGSITTPEGGRVYLIAPNIENSGIINSPTGNVLLAAGHSVQLVDSVNPDITVLVSAPEDQALNLGQIIAQSGKIGIYGGLIRQAGTVNADSALIGERGNIVLRASAAINLDEGSQTRADGPDGGQITIQSEKGITRVSGSVSATGSAGTGGDVHILGSQVRLNGHAWVDASGKEGGGTVLIGGDYQGGNPAVQNAQETFVGKDVVIKADASETGDGGKVIVWADGQTDFSGAISAKGGINGGDGGTVEVSGKQNLFYHGTTDLLALQGNTGSLLLDPTDLTIGTDITGAALGIALDSANVILQTGDTGAEAGNITVNETVNWSNGNTLLMKAHNNILINNAINNDAGGRLILRSDADANGSGNVLFGGTGQVTITGGGFASIYYNPSGGFTSPTSYSGYFTGVTPAAYMLVNNVNQLQLINTNLSGTYALGKNIDASSTFGWNAGAGFDPIGIWTNRFSGILDGNGNTISGLYINRPTTTQVGLFGVIDTAVIRNIGLVNVDVKGDWRVGGLVGHNIGSTVSNAYITGTVTGTGQSVGGLVGINDGAIDNSYSKAAVSGTIFVGGLVGANYTNGTISNSYSSGPVTGSGGGLAGFNSNIITGSYWDTQTSGQATSFGGTGRTTAQMMALATFAGWDFVNTWGIQEGTSYPYLTGGALGISGTTITIVSSPPPSPTPEPIPEPTPEPTPPPYIPPPEPAPKPTITITISPTPDITPSANIALQIAAKNTAIALAKGTDYFYSPWSSNVPYYASWDDYLKAHPVMAISWTDSAPHYASWDDYLAEHPWYVTALAMNRSPQIDAEGRFIDGLVGPLDYLTTVGSSGIGFAGLQQGGSYKGYSETSGSYLTELSWQATELDRLLKTLAAETPYDPEIAKMWEEAAVAKATLNEELNKVLDSLIKSGIDEGTLDLLTPKATQNSNLADLLKDAGEDVQGTTQTGKDYLAWLEKSANQPENYLINSLLQQQYDYTMKQEIIKYANEKNEVTNEYGGVGLSEEYFKEVVENKYGQLIENEINKYEATKEAKKEADDQIIAGLEDKFGVKFYKVPGGYSSLEFGKKEIAELFKKDYTGEYLFSTLLDTEKKNYFDQRSKAIEYFNALSPAERAELLQDENLTDAGRAVLSDKYFTDLKNYLIDSVLSEEAGFACIPLL